VSIPVGEVELEGELLVPDGAGGVVAFAHGSGSSRHSPRNNFVAEVLRERGLGTLLFDLLTEEEDVVRQARFDIPLLTSRLEKTSDWLRQREDTAELNLGYFGASTGAGAALRAAAKRDDVDAVVSRGGRVDLASEFLADVTSPTLFIVGGDDEDVLELNRDAYDALECEKRLEIVEGAGHLFEGEGELEAVADLAADFFANTLG
jgi:dienelactone hydrolase